MNEVNITEYHVVVELVHREIWESKLTFKKIAEKTGLHPRTISKLGYGETRWPRFDTVVRLLQFFGYGLYARRTNVISLQGRQRGAS